MKVHLLVGTCLVLLRTQTLGGFPTNLVVYEGDDALMTCVVKDKGQNTVMWRKEANDRNVKRILTAGENRVTSDKRFSVIHDEAPPDDMGGVPSGGDVWVLAIENTKLSDAGVYVCEVNSEPVWRDFVWLSVVPKAYIPKNKTVDGANEENKTSNIKNHNYTDCCVMMNVSTSCLGFCNIQSILEGNTGQDPENCENDFPAIVHCMADGRNHVPCCINEGVPDICQDVCRGEYTAITDNIKTHFSCSSYTEETLACIVEGIELLPGPPSQIEVEALSENSLQVEWWQPVKSNSESISKYIVNVTALRSFDASSLEWEDGVLNISDSQIITTPAPKTQAIITDLKPFTMYEITVTAANNFGTSQPSYAVRALTLFPGKVQADISESPTLPDTMGCCMKKGVGQPECVSKLCNPVEARNVLITDLMVCAPWVNETFSCMANGIDHTPCCKARGLPKICQQLCSGNVSSIDFNHFKCIRYMHSYSNCLLQGFGVLPSAPTDFKVLIIDTEFAILHWGPPKTLGDTVVYYNVFYKDMEEDLDYIPIAKVQSPYILEGLKSYTDYEVYVVAINNHGYSEGTTRIVFRTKSKIVETKIEEALTYNVTACCVEAELSNVCMPLCSYDANMTDIKTLAGVCGSEFHKLLKCGAGGRNHEPCCARRGVPTNCLSLCSGVILDSLTTTATTCIPYIGNIAMCFEEGTGVLPGPITKLHAIADEKNWITVAWEGPSDGSNITDYIIHYQKVSNNSITNSDKQPDNQLNTSINSAILKNIDNDTQYQIYVVSRNIHGTSLPSSKIIISTANKTQWLNGVSSPPHSLAVSSHSATWVTITWQPPKISHPSELISYRLYHKTTGDESFQITNTSVTSYMIQELKPNTQYIIYVTAITKSGESSPSETLIAWTDPAYPAFVEPPTVHPINLVIEGSSMTILCIAMGTPMPTISLYISGRLVRQETTRHMVTVIHNVTRDMDQISCYADNEYGTPMQASRKITISHVPHIQASGITMAAIGDSVTLECKVDAHPEPKMMFWKNHEERKPVIQGGKYNIQILPVKDEEDKHIMHLTISKITAADVGEYYCHAENAFGSATQPVSVRIRNVAATHNVTQCCIEQNVSSTCMEACSFYLDIDAVIDKPECIADFDKLMKCAADGSDHRSCCANMGVPRRCLDWCRGEPLLNNKLCVLSQTKQIMSCFHEGRDKLPGPPQNVHVQVLDAHSVKILWDPPVKNPHTVEMYRVFYRTVDAVSKMSFRNDTSELFLKIDNLKDGFTYECVVKAGNHKGTSTLTEPIKFTMGNKFITSEANTDSGSSNADIVIGVICALIVVALIGAAVWFLKTRKMLGVKNQGGVAFENPSYLREVNMDHIQGQNEGTQSNGTASNGIAVSSSSGGQGWKQEQLIPAQNEVNPTLYEELKLGQDGAGFKRLKP